MKKIENLQLNKIIILIPYINKNLISTKSIKVKLSNYLTRIRKKKHKKNKPIRFYKNIMNFKYLKSSNVNQKLNFDFSIFEGWKIIPGEWELKNKNWKEYKWKLQSSLSFSHWIMASTQIASRKNIKDVFGENPFQKNKDISSIKKLIQSLISQDDKKYRSFGCPQIFLEIENWDNLSQSNFITNHFQWIGFQHKNEILPLSLIWYLDYNNPVFIYPKNYLEQNFYNLFWMSKNFINNQVAKRVFIKNGYEEIITSKNQNWYDVNKITLQRLLSSAKRIKKSLENNYYNLFYYGIYNRNINTITWSKLDIYQKIGDDLHWKKEKINQLIYSLKDLLLEKEEEELKNKKYNRRILYIAFVTMLSSLIAIIINFTI